MSTRSRALTWDPTTAIEALAAADAALWIWTPAEDQIRFTGATRPLGLGPLAPQCSGAAFTALAMPQDRALADRLLKPQAEGTEIAVRLRMRGCETCLWRGVWLEDGLRAAGIVALETKFAGADRDTVTGLLDRRTFLVRAAEALVQPGDYELVVGDLDRLRRLNEALGHERADLVLSALGSRLSAAFSEDCAPARIGEDEFAVLVRRGGTGGGERMREALEQPLRMAGFDIYPTVSIGAVTAEGGPDAPDPAELLRRVELAVEQAKTAGRGGAAAYGRALESDSLSRLALEADLRNAFVRGEIEPFFQPIVNLGTGAVAGFEALARWRHPRRGLVPPDEFLTLADEMGLMNELGLLMMTQSARQLGEWLTRHPNAGRLFCSVNLSVGEIERAHLVEDVARIIKEAGLPRGALKLEVTEGDIMRDTARAAEVLKALREAGASLALDDFGTGFSSLSYLAKLPFDTLKIDRYFVLTMDKDEGSAKIVKSVVNLGRDLALEVVAEGVENASLAQLLLDDGCHYGQGFGYAPALPAQEAEVYLNESLADGAAPIKARSV
ncbi:bifunctional diguanylate cyclase/phosphodiesterase [Brevundimonas sp. 3P9-tot-E]|uniref:putative bifunctional diguanylate cyclase/phosphodiesterase n=1 Tax=Brevundimonas TaxID=41275 RepID=UPI001902FCDE|nr:MULTISPECIES: bifunctional diguanylate cyclase/phosphodiesterase [Brevundimonas]MBK1969953.1 bifunctional diguanylate cyclase/phosphodiesterase [Brevundimonas diminuta]MBK1976513.1 bifunctional diguanylate cyclase/phosphodiesterase [Brevundimonas diminuta]MDA0744540.1 bifunctional diguanylate cyclase/phosphodiesterase [Pseudomonadota bacterium]MDM8353188.1 bifunctional diguanylate cyclase/phosphodiesterase [Brevundimonas diminuta]